MFRSLLRWPSSLLQLPGAGASSTPSVRSLISGPNNEIFGKIPRFRLNSKKSKKKPPGFGPEAFKDKPAQDWYTYDGFGRYKSRYHNYPNNQTLRDVQRRRILEQHAEQRLRVNAVRTADILPKELRRLANAEIEKVPRDSAITRINRRCTVTGRGRGVFHQFRASRFVFRREADYNRLSGVQRAMWKHGLFIKP